MILVLMSQARINPVVIRARGIIFMVRGNINILFVSKVAHLIALPVVIDRVASNRVGVIIFVFSLIARNAFERFGPHRTTSLNRTE